MKTPEEMAEEFSNVFRSERKKTIAKKSWYTGFEEGLKYASAKWISVKDRLPIFRLYDQNNESGYTEDVLMRFVWGRIRISNFEKVDGVVSTSYGNGIDDVTHWMPLPEAPKEEK